MHALLAKLLDKRKIHALTDMTGEERSKFDEWNFILEKEELDSNQLRSFCEHQIALIEQRWNKEELSEKSITKLVQQHIVYKQIISALEAPKEEKQRLIKYLEEMIKTA
uniref:Uncharacterized protein n=1 Tax=viral metagenome TaxID=1070528 RepID=A0A6H1ZDQ0_9ZZZZ